MPTDGKKQSLWRSLGPGFITGASDDDPSGIATYAQTGAIFGYSQLWLALFTFPFMIAIQEMCGRIGMVTGKGLAAVLRNESSRTLLWGAVALLFIANTVNIGADLGAMASAVQLVAGGSFWLWLIGLSVATLLLQIFVPYPRYSQYLKFLALSLLAYVGAVFVVHQDWGVIAKSTLIPSMHFDEQSLMNIVAVLGTTIAPYLFFWQADEEVEEEIAQGKWSWMRMGRPDCSVNDLKLMRRDTAIGMGFSNVIMFFVIATAASTLGRAGITQINTAADAAVALAPLAGQFASILFALGILGTGLLTVPVLAGSAAYAVAEALGWKEGLSLTWNQARGFYAVISLSMVLGLGLNFMGIAPFQMLYYTAILNGILAPPLMVVILLLGNNKKIMGEHTNGRWSNILGWTITILMALAELALLMTTNIAKSFM